MKTARFATVASWSCALLLSASLLALAPACVGMHGQGGLDSIGSSGDKPIVEAFFEYPGPQDRWAGPSSLVVHVTARDGVDPTITLSPGVFQPEAGSVDFSSPMTAKRSGLTTAIVRERLGLVATALSDKAKDEPMGGCLSPVRARLIRSDGSLLEKRGCRSSSGWAFQASDAATDLITMAENGPMRVPAAAKATAADMKAAEAKAKAAPALERPTGIKAVDTKPAEEKKPEAPKH